MSSNDEPDPEALSSLKSLLPIAIAVNAVLASFLLISFCVMFTILLGKVRTKCYFAGTKLKQSKKLVRDELSPSAEEFLAVCNDAGISEQRVIDIYTTFDSARRKTVERWLKYSTNPTIRKLAVFQSFLSESNFVKGAGFRMHRLLHENRIPAFQDGEEGKTVLAPPFKPSPLQRINASDKKTIKSAKN